MITVTVKSGDTPDTPDHRALAVVIGRQLRLLGVRVYQPEDDGPPSSLIKCADALRASGVVVRVVYGGEPSVQSDVD